MSTCMDHGMLLNKFSQNGQTANGFNLCPISVFVTRFNYVSYQGRSEGIFSKVGNGNLENTSRPAETFKFQQLPIGVPNWRFPISFLQARELPHAPHGYVPVFYTLLITQTRLYDILIKYLFQSCSSIAVIYTHIPSSQVRE